MIDMDATLKKLRHYILPGIVVFAVGCTFQDKTSDQEEPIKSYCLDFNWGDGGPNDFAAPGLWADANPQEHIKWYKDLGVNTIQTFIVSCNGYAWYKDGIVPPQPGLKYDFLPEMVRLGHREGMKVMGYLCIGSNTRWAIENPEYSYGYPSDRHIPFTEKYLTYLDAIIRDALEKIPIDGFMIDWFYQPDRSNNNGKWLDYEKQRFEELMNKPFPGEDNLSEKDYNTYSRLAIEACWNVIHKAAKETDPNTIIWLSCFDINHPHIINSNMFKEIDWLMNEEGSLEKIDSLRNMVGENTRLITCLADWNRKDAKTTVIEAKNIGVGLYGFAKPGRNSLLPSTDHYLSLPIDRFKGDDRNIATLARFYNDLPLDFTNK